MEEKKNLEFDESNGKEKIDEPKAHVVRDLDIDYKVKENIDEEWDGDGTDSYPSEGLILDDEQLLKEIKEEDFVEPDERFSEGKIAKERKKFQEQQFKSIKKDNRRAGFIKLKNNLKLVTGSGLNNVLNAFSAYLDYLFNFVTIASIVIGTGFCIHFMLNENWIMSLISVVFSVAMTFINERIMKE